MKILVIAILLGIVVTLLANLFLPYGLAVALGILAGFLYFSSHRDNNLRI